MAINLKDIFKKGEASALSDRDLIFNSYQEFSSSEARGWMLTGARYYGGANDITTGLSEGEKLSHPYMKPTVDEKVSYLLSKPYSLTSDNDKFLESAKAALGKRFGYTLTRLGYEASNKGIGWLQAYIDPQGALKFLVIPAEQCIPVWKDNAHEELESMIRSYEVVTYEGKKKKIVTKIEYWTPNTVEHYEIHEGKLVEDIGYRIRNNIEGEDCHYTVNGEKRYWGRVPFVAFKNNANEVPDLKFIKSLIDSYDSSRSEVANFIDDVRNLVYVLKGYGGTDLREFMSDLKKFRAVKIDDPQDGGVDVINPSMDISAAAIHYERLDSDIEKFSQALPKSIEKLGSSPSGVALKFHYSGLDLKATALETEFKFGFESLMYFVKLYLAEAGKGNFGDADLDIVFNRDVAINEGATIDAIEKSATMLSKKTLLSQHPWIHDVEAELEQIEKEKVVIEPVTAPSAPPIE